MVSRPRGVVGGWGLNLFGVPGAKTHTRRGFTKCWGLRGNHPEMLFALFRFAALLTSPLACDSVGVQPRAAPPQAGGRHLKAPASTLARARRGA